jgi:hypothetical protein
MTQERYPNDDDQRALLEAQQVLAASGVAAAPSGYDLTTLAAAVYAHGWAYRIDRSAGSFQAEIRPQRDGATQPLGTKSGWSAEVALAFALAHALLRQAERSGQPLTSVTGVG